MIWTSQSFQALTWSYTFCLIYICNPTKFESQLASSYCNLLYIDVTRNLVQHSAQKLFGFRWILRSTTRVINIQQLLIMLSLCSCTIYKPTKTVKKLVIVDEYLLALMTLPSWLFILLRPMCIYRILNCSCFFAAIWARTKMTVNKPN